jgi:uncharacterized protein YndB with AHSA1/START domain
MAESERKPEPIQQSLRVDCPIEDAFRLFTEELTEWWPLASHSVSGEEAETCEIEPWIGGKVLERTRSGDEWQWGTVTIWDPPNRLAFTWRPISEHDEGQTVDIEFRVDADGTKVTLTHHGWDISGVQDCAPHAEAAANWHVILGVRFSRFVSEQMMMV